MRYLLIILTIVTFAMSQQARAQSVPVRTGEHENYSRMAFDWGSPVSYEVTRNNKQSVTITFNQNAALDMSRANLNSLSRISSISQLNESPLTIEISLEPGANIKHFKKNNSVVVDAQTVSSVDNKPKTKSIPKKEAAQKAEPKPPPVVTPEKAAPVAAVEEEKAAPEQMLKAAQEAQIDPSLFALSTISPTDMAAFELHDEIWIINSGKGQLLNPQITGPNEKEMEPIEEIPNDKAKVYKFKNIPGAELLAQGGGLAWRLLVGSDINGQLPIQPQRLGVLDNQRRGGKVIWPFRGTGEIVQIIDPITQIPVTVILVAQSGEYAGLAQEFVDFKTLNSPLGLAIMPKVDDLTIRKTDAGIEITRSSGLAISSSNDVKIAKARKAKKEPIDDKDKENKLYDFENWQLGGIEAVSDNENILLSTMPGLVQSGQIQNLLNLGKMYLANGMAPEATGFLEMAEVILPELKKNPNFIAIRGATLVINRRYEEGFKMLSNPQIKDLEDVRYFRSFALARLQDWQQAEEILPDQFNALKTYPAEIAVPLSLMLAESSLRAGDFDRWKQLLAIMQKHEKEMTLAQSAAYDYLRGEAYRQSGEIDNTIDIWSELAEGPDQLYSVRAGLALTRLEREERDLPLTEAVDRLERLRFSWRGDDLEAQVNYWLGRIYFDFKEYVKGLNIMRDAASFATGPHLGKRIIEEMTEEFSNLFLSEDLKTIPAPDAGALYDRFSELIPSGEKGDQIAINLATHMANAGLYDKSIELLSYLLNSRLQGEEAYGVAKQLTRIYMLDNQPDKAKGTLQKVKKLAPKEVVSLDLSEEQKQLLLTEAEILAMQNNPQEAIALLETETGDSDFNRLRADVAWQNGFWEDAAQALDDVITDQMPLLDQIDAVSEEEAELILQRAVALNLAGDRVRLANMREKFMGAMDETQRSQAFELITRPRRNGELADRETLLSIVSEVDLYKGILGDAIPEQ